MADLPEAPISRRQFLVLAGHLLSSCLVSLACNARGQSSPPSTTILKSRPAATHTTWAPGTHALGLGDSRDAFVHVPADAGSESLPLLVLLHGAGGSAERFLRRLGPAIEGVRVAILAPDSRGRTWDAILGEQSTLLDVVSGHRRPSGFGPDVAFLDRALERVFQKVAVDPERIAVGGFSDGATYALSLGLTNGDLFRRIVAFSPGFIVDGEPRGRSPVFISHGRSDEILPIDQCSRRIVPALEQRGYAVTFREFDGGHEIPERITREAIGWIMSGV